MAKGVTYDDQAPRRFLVSRQMNDGPPLSQGQGHGQFLASSRLPTTLRSQQQDVHSVGRSWALSSSNVSLGSALEQQRHHQRAPSSRCKKKWKAPKDEFPTWGAWNEGAAPTLPIVDEKNSNGDDDYAACSVMERNNNDDIEKSKITNPQQTNPRYSSFKPQFLVGSACAPPGDKPPLKRKRISISSALSSSTGDEEKREENKEESGEDAVPIVCECEDRCTAASHSSMNIRIDGDDLTGNGARHSLRPTWVSRTCNHCARIDHFREPTSRCKQRAVRFLRNSHRGTSNAVIAPPFKASLNHAGVYRLGSAAGTNVSLPRPGSQPRFIAGGLASSLQTWLGEANAGNVREANAGSVKSLEMMIMSARNSREFSVAWGRGVSTSNGIATGPAIKTILVPHTEQNEVDVNPSNGINDKSLFIDGHSVVMLQHPVWRVKISGQQWMVGSYHISQGSDKK